MSSVPAPATDAVDVSVLVPAKDEVENLPLFMEQAAAAFHGDPAVRYEVVVIDDGSVDATWDTLERLAEEYSFLRMARHRAGGAIEPVAAYRASAYRQRCAAARGLAVRPGPGIV